MMSFTFFLVYLCRSLRMALAFLSIAVVVIGVICTVQIEALPYLRHEATSVSVFPDSAYYAMQQQIITSLDGVTGRDFIYNWFPLLAENVTVCYPFVGFIDAEHCEMGLPAVKKVWEKGPFEGQTALVQDRFWLSKKHNQTMGVFETAPATPTSTATPLVWWSSTGLCCGDYHQRTRLCWICGLRHRTRTALRTLILATCEALLQDYFFIFFTF